MNSDDGSVIHAVLLEITVCLDFVFVFIFFLGKAISVVLAGLLAVVVMSRGVGMPTKLVTAAAGTAACVFFWWFGFNGTHVAFSWALTAHL